MLTQEKRERRVAERTEQPQTANETLKAARHVMDDVLEARKQTGQIHIELQREIVERKRAEEEIHRLHAELERRVKDRTAELKAANQELESFANAAPAGPKAPWAAARPFVFPALPAR